MECREQLGDLRSKHWREGAGGLGGCCTTYLITRLINHVVHAARIGSAVAKKPAGKLGLGIKKLEAKVGGLLESSSAHWLPPRLLCLHGVRHALVQAHLLGAMTWHGWVACWASLG